MKYVRKLYVLASVLEVSFCLNWNLSFWLLNFLIKGSRVVEMRFILYYIFICPIPREGRGWKWVRRARMLHFYKNAYLKFFQRKQSTLYFSSPRTILSENVDEGWRFIVMFILQFPFVYFLKRLHTWCCSPHSLKRFKPSYGITVVKVATQLDKSFAR